MNQISYLSTAELGVLYRAETRTAQPAMIEIGPRVVLGHGLRPFSTKYCTLRLRGASAEYRDAHTVSHPPSQRRRA